jgi:hypothetical protein
LGFAARQSMVRPALKAFQPYPFEGFAYAYQPILFGDAAYGQTVADVSFHGGAKQVG